MKYSTIKEQTPADAEKMKQCFVCDQVFKTKRDLQRHKRYYHTEMLMLHIHKSGTKPTRFSNTWRVGNFDDLFSNENEVSYPLSVNSKKCSIRKCKCQPQLEKYKLRNKVTEETIKIVTN